MTFDETIDSLRKILLKSKPNENLKSSLLQELYIKGLVNQLDDKIVFNLPFNLHSFDCGSPDCYSTDISFEIQATKPIEFPEKVDFKLIEFRCGIKSPTLETVEFILAEESEDYINYYSNKVKSNLIILGKKREMYYFPNTKPNSIKVGLIDKILLEYEDDPNAVAPYRSSRISGNQYQSLIHKINALADKN